VKCRQCLMTIMVAISVAALAACGGGSTSSQPPLAGGSTPSPAPTTTTAAPAANGELRLGCGPDCQTAGGYGAPGAQVKLVDVIKVVGGAVRLDADGYVPVTLTCLIPATCQGFIALGVEGYTPPVSSTQVPHPFRSDLLVNANSTQTMGVPLTADALAYVRAHSPVTVAVVVHAKTASCEDIPQLVATCEQIVAADPRAGDGLERYANGNLQVSAT
jgi:hypothetical protein